MLHFCYNFLIIILFLATTNCSVSNDFRSENQDINLQQKYIVKRGHGSANNDFGPPIHVSSGILQLENSTPSSSLGSVQHYNAAATNPWQGSDLSGGYEVWLDTASGGLQNYQPMHAAATAGEVGGVFSTNQVHTSFEQPTVHMVAVPMTGVPSVVDGHLSGVLHTQISSSRPHDPTTVVTGNVDFNNDVSLKSRYPSLSYGR